MHRCVKQKCSNCFLYTQKIRNSTEIEICKSNRVIDIDEKCVKCNKVLKNSLCKERHNRLTDSECCSIRYCDICDKNYLPRQTHECDKQFCQKCLKYHKKSLFCSTFIAVKKKVIQFAYFYDVIEMDNTKTVVFASLQNLKEIEVYKFLSDLLFYKKLSFNFENGRLKSAENLKIVLFLKSLKFFE